MNTSPFASVANPEAWSATIKSLAMIVVIAIKLLLNVEIASEEVDRIVEAIIVLATAGYAIYGYVRAKKVLGARIIELERVAGMNRAQ